MNQPLLREIIYRPAVVRALWYGFVMYEAYYEASDSYSCPEFRLLTLSLVVKSSSYYNESGGEDAKRSAAGRAQKAIFAAMHVETRAICEALLKELEAAATSQRRDRCIELSKKLQVATRPREEAIVFGRKVEL